MNGTTRLQAILGTWGWPVDRPALVALVVAGLLALFAVVPVEALRAVDVSVLWPTRREMRRRLIVVLAFGAAFLSLGYIAVYLHAAPRIIDATSYFLEGRVLSHGHLAWSVPTPSASFRGRFLLYREEEQKLAVIFPPGFPLLLALGFRVGAPLVVGPVLAALLVIATAWLAGELAKGRTDEERHGIMILAAALSVVCAALRYHTADTMAHGASALGITVGLCAALVARERSKRSAWLVAGLAVGWVACTRPVSSLSVGAVVLFLALRHGRAHVVLLGVLPGVGFLLFASHAQTGSWLASAQSAYYAVSDGPPGCFGYGFGAGVGCQGEHKDFVLARLPHGYGVVEAALTTFRRLRVHLLDVANLEPLALLVFVPLGRGRPGAKECRLAFAVVAAQILAYVPFYFDGSYPGGGARFFADVLPVEHALLAVAVASLFPAVALYRRALVAVAIALTGFGVHAAFEHQALAQRDGGYPFYDLEEGRVAGKGVLFLDTDHGWNLAYDPYVDPSRGILAARLKGDDHDRVLIDRLNHPQTHVYKIEGGRTSVISWTPRSSNRELWRFEGEEDWPPLTQVGGWAEPVWASTSCAINGRAMTLHVDPSHPEGTARATFELPVPRTGKWLVFPRVLKRGGKGRGRLRLIPRGEKVDLATSAKWVWEWRDDESGATPGHDVCTDATASPDVVQGVELDAAGAEWELTATGGDVSLDQTTLRATR